MPDTLALLLFSVRCVSAKAIALSATVGRLGHHLRAGDKNMLTRMTCDGGIKFRKSDTERYLCKTRKDIQVNIFIVLPLDMSWSIVDKVVKFVVI